MCMYSCEYKTPSEFDDLIMYSDGKYLTGLIFKGSHDTYKFGECETKNLDVFDETKRWLDIYFDGNIPDFTPKYNLENISSFREEVTNIMNNISYGKVVTYNDIAIEIANKRGIKKMSAQAVGGAVRSNPICIIIPCHRVVGTNNKIIGYGGGIKNKIELLKLEKNDMSKYR